MRTSRLRLGIPRSPFFEALHPEVAQALATAIDLLAGLTVAESAKVDAVLPVISIPCGFTRAGLPIGLQICGPPFGESLVLALAHAYEQTTSWHQRART